MGTVRLDSNLAQTFAVLPLLALNFIAPTCPFILFCFQFLHRFALVAHFLGNAIELRIQVRPLLLELCELAGQHQTQLGPHFVA